MTREQKDKLLQELGDLKVIYNVYYQHKFEGGFTKRQKRNNWTKLMHIGRRLNVIHSKLSSLSTIEDTSTPQ